MDFQQQQQFQQYPREPEQEVFQRRHYIAITVLFAVLASLLTFLITYIVLTSAHQKDKELVKEQVVVQMNQQLAGYEEFKTVLELYNSLPKELRNIQMYEKLAELDLYYRTFYAGDIDEENLVYMVANGYIIGAGDTFGGCVLHYILEHGLEDLSEDNLTEMLRFANAAAALITTRKGALRVMPTKEEIEKNLQKQN